MKGENLNRILRANKFKRKENLKLNKNNIEQWQNDDRIILIKEYITEYSFLNWNIEDQSIISELRKEYSGRYRNNIYFFIILNFDEITEKMKLEINRAKKDKYVCKKYIFIENKDIFKVPFLTELNKLNIDISTYDEFKNDILGIENEGNIMINKIINYYFNSNNYKLDIEFLKNEIMEEIK